MKYSLNPSTLRTVITAKKNNSGIDFTAVSLKTGKEYNFNITRKEYNGIWYTYVKIEHEYQNYLYLGFYGDGNIIFKGKPNFSDASIVAAWMLRQLEAGKFENLTNQIELYHLGQGHCLKCGRVLTDSESIRIGLGSICRA
jgi:hypothetical protein